MKHVRTARRALAAFLGSLTMGVLSSSAIAAPAVADDIRDIRGPIDIPPWWHLPLAIAVAATAALALIVLVRFWMRRSAKKLTPLELARRALATAEELARKGNSHAWADIVAETTRTALASRLGSAVLPQTTSELRDLPWAQPPLSAELDSARVLELLETCDLARFAKASLTTDDLIASTGLARELVERLFTEPSRPSKDLATNTQLVTS